MQAQIFKEGLTVEQVNYGNLSPEMRSCDRSVTINLINQPEINHRPRDKIKELPLGVRQPVSSWIQCFLKYDEHWTQHNSATAC